MSKKIEKHGSCLTIGGKTHIFFNHSFVPCEIHATVRGRIKLVLGQEVGDFIEKKNLKQVVADYGRELKESVDSWKHLTKHHRYDCDGGTLAVTIDDSATIRVGNGIGDGNFPLYIVSDRTTLPFTFEFTGVSLEGAKTISPLSYDCGGGDSLERLYVEGKGIEFWKDANGAIAIVVFAA